MNSDKLIIFDTTLRDGEQSPGASMSREQKLRIGKMLEHLRVDVIEAGFPAASVGDFEGVQMLARGIRECVVCGLARAKQADIDRAAEALRDAAVPRIHTFIATSPIHMKMKLGMEPDAVLESAVAAVNYALKYTNDVEFSPEDAGRSEIDFLCRVIEAVINAGARTINIPDTVGYNIPSQFGNLIRQLIERIPNAHKAVFSVHCHNDLGLATANSLAALQNGARQVECTINGLGERAGNAALEEIVMAVKTRKDLFNLETRIDTTQIVPTSRLVSGITGFLVQPNKAIVGANAFAHESGIHQAGVLKSRETYEIMRAEDVGWAENRMVLGKHSGRNALKARFKELGVVIDSDAEMNDLFTRFKELADRKHEIFDEDLQALLSDNVAPTERFKLVSVKYASETGEKPTARVALLDSGEERAVESTGSGPVDAVYRAIEAIVNSQTELKLYSVSSITSGTDSQGEVAIRLEKGGRIVNGYGADTDIVVASAKAYLSALNRIMVDTHRIHSQTGEV